MDPVLEAQLAARYIQMQSSMYPIALGVMLDAVQSQDLSEMYQTLETRAESASEVVQELESVPWFASRYKTMLDNLTILRENMRRGDGLQFALNAGRVQADIEVLDTMILEEQVRAAELSTD